MNDTPKKPDQNAVIKRPETAPTTTQRAVFNDDNTAIRKTVRGVDQVAAILLGHPKDSENEAVTAASSPIRFGLWIFLVVFIFGGTWAALAPLDSAAVASGSVVVESNRKSINHQEGGIIRELLVTDGDSVEYNQILVRLDDTSAKARREILQTQYRTALATRDRLLAERDGMENIQFSDRLVGDNETQYQDVMDAQRRIFESRRAALEGQEQILQQRILQLKEEIEGLRAQERGARSQMNLINDEILVVRQLVEKGQAVRPRLLALQREEAQLKGRRGEYLALIARAEQSITENQMAILNLTNDRQSEIVQQMREVQDQIADLQERLTAAEDILNRTEIRAPQSGIITQLRFHTIGSTIPPGEAILDIVPQNDALIVEANVFPQDIDIVHAGLKARVRLSAYSTRKVPMLTGEVLSVSADNFVDDRTGMHFYRARIRIDEGELSRLTSKVELYPGMPTDVLIVTGTRTLLGYLMDPITTSFVRAFREQ